MLDLLFNIFICQYLMGAEVMRAAAGTIPVVTGCHVPLSNREDVSYHELLHRFADCEWEPEYLMTEAAREVGFSPR